MDLSNNIVNNINQNEFLLYAIERRPENINPEMYQFYLELHLNDFINNKSTWINAINIINEIIKSQNSIQKSPLNAKPNPKPKNTRPTNRIEKANLLAEAALKRINKSVFKRKKRK